MSLKVESRPTNLSRSHGANADKLSCFGVAAAGVDVDRGVHGGDEMDDGDNDFKGVRVDFRVSWAPGVAGDMMENVTTEFRMNDREI